MSTDNHAENIRNHIQMKYSNYEQYKRYIWQCTNYIKNGKRSCPKCKAIREEILEGAFVDAFNLLCQDEKRGRF